MPFNGAGVFTRLYNWVQDRTNGIKINATRMDAEMDGFAAGLSQCITKDGQTSLTADFPLNGHKLVNVGNATSDTDGLNRITGDGRYLLQTTYTTDQTAYTKRIADNNGTLSLAGTGTAYVATSNSTITALATGITLSVKANATSGASSTLNLNAIGAKKIKKFVGGKETDLAQGDMIANGHYDLRYDAALDSGAGAWVLLNPSPYSKAADIASASTTDIGSATGTYVTITGTQPITSLGVAPTSVEKRVVFSGALTLTHNSASLILPGGANITTAAGDTAVFVSEGSGNWRCTSYTKASGSAIVAPPTPTFTKAFTSSEQTITVGGSLTIAHGLGVTPENVQVRLKCIVADSGFSVGDELIFNSSMYEDGTNPRGLIIVADSTNIFIRFSSSNMHTGNKTTGGRALLSAANWKLIAKAQA